MRQPNEVETRIRVSIVAAVVLSGTLQVVQRRDANPRLYLVLTAKKPPTSISNKQIYGEVEV